MMNRTRNTVTMIIRNSSCDVDESTGALYC